MPTEGLTRALAARLDEMGESGRLKGAESPIRAVVPARDGRGPRYLIEGEGTEFLRMNSNSYLGMALRAEIVAAEEQAAAACGTGPGAVRFISGTWGVHTALERRLAAFHGRPAAMLFSSAYATVMGSLPPLIHDKTAVISDALNHNCIINAIALARPAEKHIYRHLDIGELERALVSAAANGSTRAIVVTDGIFSMRGDHAPLDRVIALARQHDGAFAENAIVVVDDSHGVGAFGATGRGTEEYTHAPPADLLVGTLGKAFGVNGGYVTADATIIRWLRETSPFYIYSNPITPPEAAAAHRAVDLVDSPAGTAMLTHLRAMTARFKDGLVRLGLETLPGEHPVVPLMLRDTARTAAMVAHLRRNGILATGLNYPVVPKGDEEIRFQISADHTATDIDAALDAVARFGS
jgi:glycine C-acetyltransferase